MSFRNRLSSLAWIPFTLVSIGFLIWTDAVRVRRVDYVSGLAGWSAADSASPSLAAWVPRLVVPEPSSPSYEWLIQTRQMLATRQLRVRHVDYENAPFGLELRAASPYRWLLGSVAAVENELGTQPLGAALERAALLTDPVLLLLLVSGTAALVAWRFGGFEAALVSVATVSLFPLGGEFLAGVPDDHGLAQVCAVLSVLPVLVGMQAHYSALAASSRRWFAAAGVVGGIGLWVSVSEEVPVLAGIAAGGLLAAWIGRGASSGGGEGLPWRAWAVGGALTSLAAFLAEYFPDHLGSWQLRVIHPLYGIAWLGAGEGLTLASGWVRPAGRVPWLKAVASGLFACASIAVLPVAMYVTHNRGFLEEDLPMLRLTRIQGVAVASTVGAWFTEDGMNGAEWAAMLPLLIAAGAVGLLFVRKAGPGPRAVVAAALGPVAVAFGFACFRLSWWNGLGAVLIPLLAAATWAVRSAFKPGYVLWAWAAFAALVILPGASQIWPAKEAGAPNALSESEVIGLIERDLARWLVNHAAAGKVSLLAPPDETPALYYYAGIPGLATLGWEIATASARPSAS